MAGNMKLSTKLISTYLLVGIVPLALIGVVAWLVASRSLTHVGSEGSDALQAASYGQLTALRTIKKQQIENYFADRQNDLSVLVETVGTLRREAFDNLAQRAGEAARETSKLIVETVGKVNHGAEIVTGLESSFEDIQQNAGKVATLVSEITAASNEQAQGIEQVNTAISQMDQVTRKNAANAEESASASEALSSQAVQLDQMVRDLARLIGGMQANSQAPSLGKYTQRKVLAAVGNHSKKS